MSLEEAFVSEITAKLSQSAPSALDAFHQTLTALPADLDDARLRLWAEQAVVLATHSERSWEACIDYLRAVPQVLPLLSEDAFKDWVSAGCELADQASAIACSYFRATPAVLPLMPGVELPVWARTGSRLYKATWKSISLVSEFFGISASLLQSMTLTELARFGRVLEGISDRSADLAAASLAATPNVVRSLTHPEWLAFIDFAAAVSDTSWPEASLYFERGPDLIRNVDSIERAHYLEMATRVARRIGRQAYALFADGSLALKDVDSSYHGRLIELANRLIALSPLAAMSLIKSSPMLAGRLRLHELEVWHAAGLEILEHTIEGGEAYFRLESGKAEQSILTLSARVDLSGVSDLLRLYSKALTGTNLSVQPITALQEKGIGWVTERGPSTEGSAVYLPEFIEQFDNKADNFGVFKVYATHQAAHLEFLSFSFDFKRAGKMLPRKRHLVERKRRRDGLIKKRKWLTEMEHFFDLFSDRQMASDLFTIVEDLRVDSIISDQYSGIRRANRSVQTHELDKRPPIRGLPLRQAFVESLIRASLDGKDTIVWPERLDAVLQGALATLDKMRSADATIEDAAEATILLYDIAERLPNLPPEDLEDMDWKDFPEERQGEEPSDTEQEDELNDLPDGEEMPYSSPEMVDFRGDFKPEMVQLLMRLRMQKASGEEVEALTPEQIMEMLNKSVEIDTELDDLERDEFTTFLENLVKETGQTQGSQDEPPEMEQEEDSKESLSQAVKVYLYDEWDFRASDYKPRWCAVRERIIEEGSEDFYQKTLRDHSSLVNETQRQFEMLKPETFRKRKHLEDGEDIDLDAALDFIVQKRAGRGDVPKIYWRRNKIERDVAVAFLLDMSASTDEEVEKLRLRRDATADSGDPRRYFSALAQTRQQQLTERPKRIIDLEKESIVLLTRALETIHDRYGIYGFSGYGRENVEYFVIKDMEEPFDEIIQRRIDQITPIRSTRMGPAIRHTTYKLGLSPAKAKILFLVSDGRPQDHGYGRDRTEKEYAIHDTHMALLEAKHKGIVPFALTVDKEGHDYLGQMCGDIAYEVLSDIDLLPSRLPTLYRRLTE